MNASPDPALLDLRGVTQRYGSTTVLHGVDLHVAPGETVALLGPNGAGKSTLVSVLLGLARPVSGTAAVCGRPPAQAVADGCVGAMLQDAGLPDNTRVGQLVELFAALYPRPMDVGRALELADAADLRDRPSGALSGGQAQRVRLALALVADPELLVLDEPTAAMDPQVRRTFWDALSGEIGGERGLLFATHHLDEAQAVADRVVVLAGGRIVADGTPAEVAARAGGTIVRVRTEAVAAELAGLPGVLSAVDESGGRTAMTCSDSDRALRVLLETFPDARDIEVRPADLEDAFLTMAADGWTTGVPAPAEA
ncbi:ABC transporter ATP-binding protein [Patulibacter sp.]|uniref:ABC transporter ATP-binding protein n=1 Tax=Patulibacter sp. TaxID=1912859 RepID=UPI0027265380|nr:ABC transporter ATP-binding protein [Patulibacter sp.]MDO9409194.1 ABC transporter ATP-binding protein [Patulibacter sp.]